MQKKVKDFIEQNGMLHKGDSVVVGVSGGPDSVCLLLLLKEIQQELELKLAVAHIEHGIRGQASKDDMKFVRELCEQEDISFYGYSFQVEEIATREKMSVEEAGRKVRYETFEKVRQETGSSKIAIAHNSNDCAETMLFHLARGTGMEGLHGIEPVRGRIIRPILCLEREEIMTYLSEQNQAYCIDATNNELVYTRNKIRHQALPVLKEVNEQAVSHMLQTAGLMREAGDYLKHQVEKLCEKYILLEKGTFFIKEELFLEEEAFIRKQCILKLLKECAGSGRNIGSVHVEQVEHLFTRQVGRRVNLPTKMMASRVYGGILLEKVSQKTEINGKIDEIHINPPMRILLDEEGTVLEVRLLTVSEEKPDFPKKEYTKWIDYAKIKHGLCVRTRQPGDFITVDSKGNTKKIKEYFINEKIPADRRSQIPLIADGKEIVWVTGKRMSECYKVSGETEIILEIKLIGGKVHE